VDKNILICCDHWTLFKKNQICATSAGHAAGTEAMTSRKETVLEKLEAIIHETKM